MQGIDSRTNGFLALIEKVENNEQAVTKVDSASGSGSQRTQQGGSLDKAHVWGLIIALVAESVAVHVCCPTSLIAASEDRHGLVVKLLATRALYSLFCMKRSSREKLKRYTLLS